MRLADEAVRGLRWRFDGRFRDGEHSLSAVDGILTSVVRKGTLYK